MDGLVQDVRYAARNLRRSPEFALIAVATLAVGIGINAAVFTVTDAVLFKGFPLVERNDRLLYISNGGCCISYPDFEDIRAQAKSFLGIAIVHGVGKILTDGRGFAENIDATEVSAGTFRVVGRQPVLGRDFTHADEIDGAAPVAILSYVFWENRYGGDPKIIGRTIRLNGTPATIIGIMARGFSFPQKADLWVPLVQTVQVQDRNHTDTWFAFGRVSDGTRIESARAEVETIIRRLEKAYPVTDQRFHLVVQNFHQFFLGANAAALYGSMWGAVGFVLLIACANLANLLLARAMERSREVSVRMALGAGRWRVVRQLLIESIMLSGLGGFLGWWIARWGVRAYQLAMAQKASWLVLDYTMDRRVLGYLIVISIATGLLFGLAPALRLSKLDFLGTLKDGARGTTGGRRGPRVSSALVTAEMALTIVLLAGAGLMIRSFLKIETANMGINTARVAAASVNLPAARYGDAASRISFYDRLTSRLESTPGVESVALAGRLPSWNADRRGYELAGAPSADARRRPKVPALVISPGYFVTLEARLLSGRDFVRSDENSRVPVAIVNQKFASAHWPGENPIGKRLRLFDGNAAGPWLTVVGVVSNILQNDAARQRFEPVVYLPYRQNTEAGMWIFARTRIPPGQIANAFRREIRMLDAGLPVYGPFGLAEHLEMYWDSRFYGVLFLIFAGVALLLASVGLYAVMAHAVSRRTQEIGIRMAVGATRHDILAMVLRQGMAPLGLGLAIGLAGAFALTPILKSTLVNVSPADPVAFGLASTVLLVAAALGCLIPARGAMRVDPAAALRHE